MDTLKDIPEFFEVDLGEAVLSRTESLANFRELGPPDLCHVVKTMGRSSTKDVGSYHYVSGVDASSSASLAAYINSLSYALEETPGWFSAKGKSDWKIRSGCFCSFNAFSRVDVRVEVKIPGGVDAYVVDLRGDRHPPTAAIWTEVYLSAILRSILYADDSNYKIAGYRKLDPIRSLEDEVRFLAAAESCSSRAWLLGSDPEIQVATNVSNHLTSAVLKYFSDAGRHGPAVNLFEKLVVKDGEMASLLARSYIGMDEEVKAVQVLYKAIQEHPQSYPLLHVQADFLRNKGKSEWAFKLARQAVNCAPSEFVTWAKLTEVNIELRHFNDALLTLNSCPMFAYNERDLHRMPTPSRTHLPVKAFITESNILATLDASEQDNEADLTLLRLPAPSLRGTYKKAYELLTLLVHQLGWDELLRTRSEVFVMEEEYRIQKQMQDETPVVTLNGASPGSNHNGKASEGADDDASIRGVHGTTPSPSLPTDAPPLQQLQRVNGFTNNSQNILPPLPSDSLPPKSPSSPIPEIRISQHTEALTPPPPSGDSTSFFPPVQQETAAEPFAANDDGSTLVDIESTSDHNSEAGGEEGAAVLSDMSRPAPGVEKPELSHAPIVQDASDEAAAKEAAGAASDVSTVLPQSEKKPHTATTDNNMLSDDQANASSFTNKRLCERWLDNLFMVLYEDLRVYTIWRAEIAHFKSQHVPYRKTPTEWEILGDLALRLHHREEAKDAYQRCLDQKFSAKAWMKLLEFYVDDGDVQRALNAAIRLATYQYRWYMETAYPTAVAHQLYRLIQREGVSKISYSLVSSRPLAKAQALRHHAEADSSVNLPAPLLKHIMQPIFQFAQVFNIPGSEY